MGPSTEPWGTQQELHLTFFVFFSFLKAAVGHILLTASLFGVSKGQWDIFLL